MFLHCTVHQCLLLVPFSLPLGNAFWPNKRSSSGAWNIMATLWCRWKCRNIKLQHMSTPPVCRSAIRYSLLGSLSGQPVYQEKLNISDICCNVMLLHSTPDIIMQNSPPVLPQTGHQLQHQQVRNSANIYHNWILLEPWQYELHCNDRTKHTRN
jgi:hypothetical protein